MATGLTVTVGGTDVYDLNDVARFLWVADEGLGLSPLHRITERGPEQHGDSDLGFKLDPRTIKLIIAAFGTDRATYWDVRSTLLQIFNPAAGELTLTWTLDNGAIRALDVVTSGEGSMPSSDSFKVAQQVGLMLRAKDPTYYDPVGKSVTFGIGGGSVGFTVPMAVPTGIGSTSIAQSKTITYGGTWRALPDLIRIKGPITDPVITNVATGEKLDFTGTTIASGAYYDIDCSWDAKTIVDQLGANQYSKLVRGSSLNTFHLAPAPEVPGGLNDIRVSGTGITNVTEIYIQYFERFVGI